jgi:F0F1-type ATP synthase assembly protein I
MTTQSDLEKRVTAARKKIADKEKGSRSYNANSSGKIVIDMISGLAVGAFFGYFVDIALDTSPLMLIILTISGAGGGFYNFYKDHLKEIDKTNDR